ncbi:ESPL1 protein, partial [Malurus elegans]|nr:ESPL1 protein [Malurus elegans]
MENPKSWCPPGVTVVQLSLVSANPAGFGAALLLTRLERDTEPLSVRIGTGNGRAPLSSILQELDLIQRGQREANGVTERQEWWERRSRLDQRMESLIQSLEGQVLGCWKGLLLPRDPKNSGNFGNSTREEEEELLRELRDCGWDSP